MIHILLTILLCICTTSISTGSSNYYGTKVLISYNYPDYVIGIRGTTEVYILQDVVNQFQIVKGLDGNYDSVSFQSLSNSNIYIRHKLYLVFVDKNDNTKDFQANASFYIRMNKYYEHYAAFESANYPGYFLRHQGYRMKLHKEESGSLYKKDSSFDISTPNSVILCEFDTKSEISCKPGYYIRILGAMYGRKDSSICHRSSVVDCVSAASLSVVKNECENEEICTIDATNSWFGDPCVGVEKYLEVHYFCSKKENKEKPKEDEKNNDIKIGRIAAPVILFVWFVLYACKDEARRRRYLNRLKSIFRPVENNNVQPVFHISANEHNHAGDFSESSQNNIPSAPPNIDPPPPYHMVISNNSSTGQTETAAVTINGPSPPSYQETMNATYIYPAVSLAIIQSMK